MYEMGREESKAVEKVILSKQLFRYRGGEGGECDRFESALCKKIGAKHSILVSGGTGALICGLVGIDIGPGDEVIVPAYTFMASPLSVVALGAVPVIAEVDESLLIDPADVEKKITRRTKAIMPVHMTGLPANMNALKKIARKHNLKIIEDACQAVGGSYKGRRLATIGDVGAFSFNQFKIIGCGEGGAVVTSQRSVFEKALIQHDGGCFSREHVLSTPIFCGWSYRVCELQGAIMRVQLRRLDRILANLRARKRAMFAELAGSDRYAMSPVNCTKGDCGVVTAIKFESEALMRAAQKALHVRGIPSGSPIDSGIHVYSRWSPILQKRASSHPGRDAYKLTGQRYRYSKTMCPRTTAILSSTLTFGTSYSESVAENRRRVAKARKIIERM